MADQFIEAKVEASRAALAAIDTPQLLYLLVQVKPAHPDEHQRAPLHLSLVVDRPAFGQCASRDDDDCRKAGPRRLSVSNRIQ